MKVVHYKEYLVSTVDTDPRVLTWCFSTSAAVATVLSIHTCIFSCSWVNNEILNVKLGKNFVWIFFNLTRCILGDVAKIGIFKNKI